MPYHASLKATVNVPESDTKNIVKHTRAKTKREAIPRAGRKLNGRKRLEVLAERLHGAMPNFMTQGELRVMREDAKWEATR